MAIKSSQQRGLNGFDSESLLKAQGIRAVGGTVTESGNYKIHTFTGSGQLTIIDPTLMVEYLIVAGGGSGGNTNSNSGTPAGGGGAGGVLTGVMTLTKQSYTITIGGGGTTQSTTQLAGNNGSNTTALGLTAVGGGGGGGDDPNSPFGGTVPDRRKGKSGGSGGGASNETPTAALGTIGQGSNGGTGGYVSGGGGAGGIGIAGLVQSGGSGAGGIGIQSSISGNVTYYGGGGGSGSSVSYGGDSSSGGLGGGGKGGISGGATAVSGGSNTGGGGGGTAANGGATPLTSGAGGSGIVIVRYTKNQTTINEKININEGLILNLDASNELSFPNRFPSTLSIEYLIVAGGGGGGGGTSKSPNGTANSGGGAGGCGGHGPGGSGGGGGAGGLVYGTTTLNINQTSSIGTIVVGSGGTSISNGTGNKGTDSSAFGITAAGGGGGASYTAEGGNYTGTNRLSGGSGGGGDGPDNNYGYGGSGSSGQGYAGGRARNYTSPNYPGAGGGGAGGIGQDSQSSTESGKGGNGLYYGDKFGLTLGASGWFSGGGGGGSSSPGGLGGGTTGGIGGGSGNGGSGIVCVRYLGSQKATGGTITTVNGYTVHTFTSSGTFTPTDTTKTGWTDISGFGNHGILNNGASFNSSNGGNILLDGVNDWINLPTTGFGLATLSAEFWVKFNATGNGSYWWAIADSSGGNPELRLQITAANKLKYIWYDTSAYIVDSLSQATLALDTWYHITNTTQNNDYKFYINGVIDGNFTGTTYNGGTLVCHSIGTYNLYGTSPGYGGYTSMSLGSYKFYNRVLSSAEVLQNYNSTKLRFGL
jgi:hypothetical protein